MAVSNLFKIHIAQPLPVLASTGLLMTMVLVSLIQVQIAVKTDLNGSHAEVLVTKTGDEIGRKRLNRSLSGDNKRNVE